MSRLKGLALLVVTAALFAGCGVREQRSSSAGTTTAGLGGGVLLDTHYRTKDDHPAALLHVLWVPDFEVPAGGGFGTGSGASSTADRSTFRYTFYGGSRIDAQPVTLRDGEFVQGGGSTYLLSRGNVFVAKVSPDGAVRLTQVRSMFHEVGSAQEVLEAIQAAVDDPRVDAIARRSGFIPPLDGRA